MNFPRWKLTKFSQNITSNGIQIMILNTKQGWVCKGSFYYCKFMFHSKKKILYRFPEKWALIKVKYWLPVCQILWTFSKRNRRKFTVTFVFCGHVHLDIIKILILKNTNMLWAFVLSTHAVVKLKGAPLNTINYLPHHLLPPPQISFQ